MKADLPSAIAIVGLGYVGLPLAVAFARSIPTIGFDIDENRVRELQGGYDRTGEVSPDELKTAQLQLSHDPTCLQGVPFIIVAVPTPIDRAKRPDLSHLIHASQIVGRNLKPVNVKPIIVYESTVYPGCTEEVCIPILEQESGLTYGRDFKVGYSPERINPGDREHTLDKVVKVVAGQDAETTDIIARVYGMVARAGVYKAPDIRTAEAAKVIENVQRDLNIALMNELSLLFHRLGLDTHEVLKAARTKWNFLPFEAGLVGGHCIPVDPYYLTHKAQEVGYHPEVILAGRRINDSMGVYVARQTVKLLIQAGKVVRGARALVLGVTFKENVPDVRNTRVTELVQELQDYGVYVVVYDPLLDEIELQRLQLRGVSNPFSSKQRYDCVVLAVAHKEFREKSIRDYLQLLQGNPSVFVDVKGIMREVARDERVLYWSL